MTPLSTHVQLSDGKQTAEQVAAAAAQFEERTAKAIVDHQKKIADYEKEGAEWWKKSVGTENDECSRCAIRMQLT